MNFKVNKKQKEVVKYWFDDNVDTIVFSGGILSGKEYIAVNLLLTYAFTNQNTKLFIATKYIKTFIRSTHLRIEENLLNLGINEYCKFNILNYRWEFLNGSTIQYLDISFNKKDPYYDRLSCMQFNRGWISSADEIKTNYFEEIYEERAIPKLYGSVVSFENKKIIHTCLPCENYLYYDYYLKHVKNELGDESKMVISESKDCLNLSKVYLNYINKIINT